MEVANINGAENENDNEKSNNVKEIETELTSRNESNPETKNNYDNLD